MTTQTIDRNLNAIVGALKTGYNIDMECRYNISYDEYTITFTKGIRYRRFKISRYEFEDSLFDNIIRENAVKFLKEIDFYEKQQIPINPTTIVSGEPGRIYLEDDDMVKVMDSIVLNDLKNAEDVSITKFSKEDLDAIQRMKEAARKIGAKGNNPIIAGGFFTSIFWNQEPRDIDVFYLDGDGEDFHIPEENVSLKEGEYLKNPMITKVASFSVTKRQFIFTKYKTRRELVDHFDMLHCCVSYDAKEDKLYISPAALDAIKHKAIIPNGKNKIAQWRFDKMMRKGWMMVPE